MLFRSRASPVLDTPTSLLSVPLPHASPPTPLLARTVTLPRHHSPPARSTRVQYTEFDSAAATRYAVPRACATSVVEHRPLSSVGQSYGLLIRRSWVRAPQGVLRKISTKTRNEQRDCPPTPPTIPRALLLPSPLPALLRFALRCCTMLRLLRLVFRCCTKRQATEQ